jgi:hypothetical protein
MVHTGVVRLNPLYSFQPFYSQVSNLAVFLSLPPIATRMNINKRLLLFYEALKLQTDKVNHSPETF